MEPPEDQLHVVPNVDGAEARLGLSEGHELVAAELVRLHGDRVEREGLVDGKICRRTKRMKPGPSAGTWVLGTGGGGDLR